MEKKCWFHCSFNSVQVTSVKFRITHKLILAASYFLTLSIILYLTWNVPYRQNRTALDISGAIGPVAISLVTFMVLRNKNKKRAEIVD